MSISYRKPVAILAGVLFASSALANYHVTAFGNSPGFKQIMSEDYANASVLLDSSVYSTNEYARLANLCVAQLKTKDVDAALKSCDRALSLAPAELRSSLVARTRKVSAVMTHLYSNRGVVRAVNGDLYGARADFEQAVALDDENSNARRNLEYVASHELAARAE
jgi:Flp pilus assembly protein TadD